MRMRKRLALSNTKTAGGPHRRLLFGEEHPPAVCHSRFTNQKRPHVKSGWYGFSAIHSFIHSFIRPISMRSKPPAGVFMQINHEFSAIHSFIHPSHKHAVKNPPPGCLCKLTTNWWRFRPIQGKQSLKPGFGLSAQFGGLNHSCRQSC